MPTIPSKLKDKRHAKIDSKAIPKSKFPEMTPESVAASRIGQVDPRPPKRSDADQIRTVKEALQESIPIINGTTKMVGHTKDCTTADTVNKFVYAGETRIKEVMRYLGDKVLPKLMCSCGFDGR